MHFQVSLAPQGARSELPLHRQLYGAIRDAILQGTLRAGTRVPSTRALADDLQLSRNTVLTAFDQLLAEGYLEGRPGSGTFVCRVLPEAILQAEPAKRRGASKIRRTDFKPSRRGEALVDFPAVAAADMQPHPFQLGIPALDAFPFEIWSRLWARRWRSRSAELLVAGNPAGFQPLREVIAEYVRTVRAVECDPEQILVVSGSRRGLDLVARVLTEPGDSVWVEDPCYPGARKTVQNAGLQVVPVSVDQDGLVVEAGLKQNSRPKLAIVTPSHQYPLGVTLSLPRRLALLDWAHQIGSWIVEDDYDSDYRYSGRSIPALQGLDRSEHVIYLGSFNKVLYPSLRLGYVIVPRPLVSAFVSAHAVLDGQPRFVDQAVLADFMREGHLVRHIRRMRTLYAQRQTALLRAAARHLSGLLEIEPSESGMHVVGWLPPGTDDRVVVRRAAEQGVTLAPLSSCYQSPEPTRCGVLLGYAGFSSLALQSAVRKLTTVLPEVAMNRKVAGTRWKN